MGATASSVKVANVREADLYIFDWSSALSHTR